MGLKWVPLVFAAFKVGSPLGAFKLTVHEFPVGPLVFAALRGFPMGFGAFEVGSPMGSQWVPSGFPWFLQHWKRVPSGFPWFLQHLKWGYHWALSGSPCMSSQWVP